MEWLYRCSRKENALLFNKMLSDVDKIKTILDSRAPQEAIIGFLGITIVAAIYSTEASRNM